MPPTLTEDEMDHDGARGADLLGSPVRRALVDTLVEAGANGHPDGLTAAELAATSDLHVTTIRFHLDQLVVAGILDSGFRRSAKAGRPSKVYRVATGSFDEAVHHESYRILAELLAKTLTSNASGHPITPEEAGQAWARDNMPPPDAPQASTPGQWMGKIGQMVDVLHDWGYTPEVSTTRGGRTAEIRLAHCPFLDMARENPALVCGIHRGLIAGAMECLGETDTQVSLEPFVGPSLCLAHITTQAEFDRPPMPPGRRTA